MRYAPSLICLMLAAPALDADVTLEEVVRMEGAGAMSLANMSIHTTTRISGDRSRTDSDMKMQSGVMNMFARGGPRADIVRLDQDMTYSLDLKKKRYTQMSLADQRAQMQQAMAQAQEAQQSQQQTATGVDESQCEWSEPRSEKKVTGEQAVFGGFAAQRTMVTASQSCTDKSTGSVCDFALTLDQWLTPSFPAEQETLTYYRAYAEKMGFDTAASKNFLERAQQNFGRYQGLWTEVARQMADVQGYPVKSSFSLAVGGPQCASETTPTATADTTPPSTTETVGRAMGGAIGGAIGGLFGRKKQEAAAAEAAATTPPPAAAPANGLMPLMTLSTELVSVSTSPIGADQFEVPAGFKPEQ
jgi:hypothetical protein